MIQAAVELGSAWTVRRAAPRRSSAGPSSSGGRTRTLSPRCSQEPGRELGGIDEEIHRRVAMRHRERERYRRVGDVAAADVQQPRDRIGRGEDDCVDPVMGQELADLALLVRGRPAGMLQVVGNDRAPGRRRLVVPDPVHEVLGHGNQGGPRLGAHGLKTLHALDRVEPRVVAQPVSRPQMEAEPLGGRALRHVVIREDVSGVFVPHLERVPPVHEDGGRVLRDHRQARRSGEAADPSETLGPGRHVLALMLVRPRDEECREALLLEPLRSLSTRSWIVIAMDDTRVWRGRSASRARRARVLDCRSRRAFRPRARATARRRARPGSSSAGRDRREAPRSWPTPGSRWSDVGAGIAVRGAPELGHRGERVSCPVDEERWRVEAREVRHPELGRPAGRMEGIGEQQERSRQARLVRGQEARLAAPVGVATQSDARRTGAPEREHSGAEPGAVPRGARRGRRPLRASLAKG